MNNLVLTTALIALGAAFTSPGAHAGSPFDQEPKGERKFDIIQYFAQDGREVSFGGDTLIWKGPGDCSQQEEMLPLISVQGDGVTIRNATIVDSPDGIHVSGDDVILEDLIFPKVCEDAITANGANRLIIRNCWFRGARDKVIQLNSGKDILIENCVFEDCSKPIRTKEGVTATVRNNRSTNSLAFVLSDGPGAEILVEDNEVSRSKWFVKASDGTRIIVNSNRTSQIEKQDEAEDGAEILSAARIIR